MKKDNICIDNLELWDNDLFSSLIKQKVDGEFLFREFFENHDEGE